MRAVKLRWWCLFVSILAGAVIGGAQGVFSFIWQADQTKISFLILGLFVLLTAFIGWATVTERLERYKDSCWFWSDAMIRLGILTTVLGFILMFTGATEHLDLSNSANVRALVVSISHGLTTALVGTLVGVLTSLLAGAQLINYREPGSL